MKRRSFVVPLVVGVGSFLLFLFFQATGIYGGDSGDLVTAAYEFGVPHPPGYPLYTLLTWFATRLPVATPAWRAGLVSSLPHAFTLLLVFLFARRLCARFLAGLFASLVLLGNYLFFLYSVTPEVFALFDLFVVLVMYLLFLWDETKNSRYVYLFSFVFGLSLTHHHVMLFLIPGIAYFIWKGLSSRRTSGSRVKKAGFRVPPFRRAGKPEDDKGGVFFRCATVFIVGLLPYLYIPIAARAAAIVNWDRSVDWQGFVRLLTRQDYGSFVPNGFYGALPIHRWLALKAYSQFLLLDLTWVGIALTVLGFVFLWRENRRVFWLLLLSLLFIGPGFFFYASFPLMNRFSLGTYERFLLPSYTIFAIVMGIGASVIIQFSLKRSHLFRLVLVVIMFSLPLTMLLMTIWRFWGLRYDRTADELGEDMLASVPMESILLLSRDTPLFIGQYVRYGLGVRPDIKLIHANRLWGADYPATIQLRFPELVVPQSEPGKFALALVRANRDQYPIYTNTTFPVDNGWFWVQEGLAYRLTAQNKLPSLQQFIDENDRLWNSFRDPRQGILGRYRHLMLSDVLSAYADARIAAGKTILRGGNTADAKRYFREALAYRSDIEEQDGYTYLGLAELFDNHCDEAIAAFVKARVASLVPDVTLTFYEGVTYRDACKNKEKARELMRAYETARQERDIPLR